MKTTQKLLIAILSILTLPVFSQVTISDVTLPAFQKINDASLKLNGGGLREKLWIDLYVAGLYLSNKTTDAQKVINADEAMNIHIAIISSLITREKFLEAVNEGFVNSTNGNTAKFKEEIPAFIAAFKDEIVKGDNIDISYTPAKGVVVLKNGKMLTSIRGLEFKKALYGIWFGAKPADKNLMKGMLGL